MLKLLCVCIVFFFFFHYFIYYGLSFKKTDERYIEWQRVTTNDNELYTEWQRVRQRVTTNDKEWQRVVILANFTFFWIREEPTTIHPKETLWTLKRILKWDWSKDRNKSLRRNINRKKQVSRWFSCLWYMQL